MLEDVLSYIQEHMTDIQAKNQIFPRAVCLYCRYVTGEANAQKRYLLCREAFENSRKDQRFEYTVELLGYMRKDAICLGKEFEAVSYQVWKKILEAMYQEYGVEIPQAEWGIEIPQNLFLIPEIFCFQPEWSKERLRKKSAKESVRRRRIPESKQESEVRV